MTELPSITCPQCGRTSHHPRDISERYCGACHQFHDDMCAVVGHLWREMGVDQWECMRCGLAE